MIMPERNIVTNYEKDRKNSIIGISRKTNQTSANSKRKEGPTRTSVFCLG